MYNSINLLIDNDVINILKGTQCQKDRNFKVNRSSPKSVYDKMMFEERNKRRLQSDVDWFYDR